MFQFKPYLLVRRMTLLLGERKKNKKTNKLHSNLQSISENW